MAYTVNGTTITLTRGDSFAADITIYTESGDEYTPTEGDRVRFAMKASYEDPVPLVVVDIPIDTMVLKIEPEHTKILPFGNYVYDIQLTTADGVVDTFIAKAKLKLTEEVH